MNKNNENAMGANKTNRQSLIGYFGTLPHISVNEYDERLLFVASQQHEPLAQSLIAIPRSFTRGSNHE